MKTRILFAAIALLGAASTQAATTPAKPMAAKGVKCGDSYIAAGKVCTKAPVKPMGKGVPCGDSFIAAGQVCHKPTMPMAAKPAMAPAKPMMAKPAMAKPMMTKPAPMAAKGKKCGNSYIAATAVCTKK